MNKRIEQCLYQAGLTAQGCWDELDDYAKEGIEKFAELIIQECLQTCKDVGIESKEVWNASKDYQEGRQMGAEVCHNMIKKHFGVE
jgi:hypothetical protein